MGEIGEAIRGFLHAIGVHVFDSLRNSRAYARTALCRPCGTLVIYWRTPALPRWANDCRRSRGWLGESNGRACSK